MLRWLEHLLGALLMLLVLLDVFLTVLYARAGTGLISRIHARWTWCFFRAVSRPFGRVRGLILSFAGPAILVSLVLLWAFLLAVGAALIIHPNLGASVRAGSGETPTSFITALYAGGSSLSLVGASNFSPQTSGFRLLYLFNSLIGTAVISLTLTYLMQVYNALQRRNKLGLNLELSSAETGDAAELIAGLGPEGKFDAGYSNLSEIAGDVAGAKESHHFYPVLFYFRFDEPYYSMSRSMLVALDTVTLIKSALDDDEYAWLKESAAVAQLWRASMLLAKTLRDTFLSGNATNLQAAPDAQTLDGWRRRYSAALRRLGQAGLKTRGDEQAGADLYVSLRAEWDHRVKTLAAALAYRVEEIDTAGSRPQSADERQEFSARLHSAG